MCVAATLPAAGASLFLLAKAAPPQKHVCIISTTAPAHPALRRTLDSELSTAVRKCATDFRGHVPGCPQAPDVTCVYRAQVSDDFSNQLRGELKK